MPTPVTKPADIPVEQALINAHRNRILEFAAKNKLPAIAEKRNKGSLLTL
jgi:hypothetical protein